MATNLLSVASTVDELSSGSVTVAVGGVVTFGLKGSSSRPPADSAIELLLTDDGSTLRHVAMLHTDNPSFQVSAPGVYKARRLRGTCGAFYVDA